ncbi:MAG TPA: polysaccharide deacetylase family protein [Gemmatimonadaceae bacterium]|nr:polysaccharide deacetylase family protein [Gemmatimonadaceae bacterium]
MDADRRTDWPASTASGPTVAFTVDLEPDCPPFLRGFRGIEEGLPSLLALLAARGVPATFFTTGEVAARYPAAVQSVVNAGHELGCHGMSHTAFTALDPRAAADEIDRSADLLRAFAPVTSFRAPYLRFPDRYIGLVERAGFTVDSSQAKYKAAYYASRSRRMSEASPLRRIPASVTSSVLRLPRWVRTPYLSALASPVVLFVHPWEFVDLTAEPIRLDCRFKTGQPALACVDQVLRWFQNRHARFAVMRDLRVRA